MLYLSNFFARGIEAVSIQIETARNGTEDPIIACGYFLEQKCLNLRDIQDNIWVFPPWLFPIASTLTLLFTKQPVHYFEDEPSAWRKFLLNLRKRDIYISLFKDVTPELIQYIKSLKYLKGITVELKDLEEKLKSELSGITVLRVLPQPLWTEPLTDDRKSTFIFASWNQGDEITLRERGILNVLELSRTTGMISTIILRDNDTSLLKSYIQKFNLCNQVRIVRPKSRDELHLEFSRASYVIMLPQKSVTKDVPNSIIDGLALGKPCIIASSLKFSREVSLNNLGIVWDITKPIADLQLPNQAGYVRLSNSGKEWIKNSCPSYSHSMKQLYEV